MTPSARSKLGLAAALGLLAAALVLVPGAVIAPVYLAHRHYDARLAQLHGELARLRRVAATRPVLEAKLAALKAREPHRGFLKNVGAALAASEIQELARGAIESNGGKLHAVQIKPHQDEGRFRLVTVNVQFNATAPAQGRILRALEGALPYLFVDNVVIRSNAAHGYRPTPGVEAEHSVQLDISGTALAGA